VICAVDTDTWNKQCHLEFRCVEEREKKNYNLSENVHTFGPSDSVYFCVILVLKCSAWHLVSSLLNAWSILYSKSYLGGCVP